MLAKLYLPYYPEGGFANDENDMSDEEYANTLLNNFGASYSRYMDNMIGGFVDDRYNVMEVIPEKYQIKGVKDTTKVQYYTFECQLNNEEDEQMSTDEFEFYLNSGDMCAFFVHILMPTRRDEIDPDSFGELNFWLKDSRGVMHDPHIDDEHRVAMLPHKDLIVVIGTFKYLLSGSRDIDQDNTNNFAIIVNKIKNI